MNYLAGFLQSWYVESHIWRAPKYMNLMEIGPVGI